MDTKKPKNDADVPPCVPPATNAAPPVNIHAAVHDGLRRLREAPSPRPSIYPCGCSRLKVAAGLCSVYDTDGTERSE